MRIARWGANPRKIYRPGEMIHTAATLGGGGKGQLYNLLAGYWESGTNPNQQGWSHIDGITPGAVLEPTTYAGVELEQIFQEKAAGSDLQVLWVAPAGAVPIGDAQVVIWSIDGVPGEIELTFRDDPPLRYQNNGPFTAEQSALAEWFRVRTPQLENIPLRLEVRPVVGVVVDPSWTGDLVVGEDIFGAVDLGSVSAGALTDVRVRTDQTPEQSIGTSSWIIPRELGSDTNAQIRTVYDSGSSNWSAPAPPVAEWRGVASVVDHISNANVGALEGSANFPGSSVAPRQVLGAGDEWWSGVLNVQSAPPRVRLYFTAQGTDASPYLPLSDWVDAAARLVGETVTTPFPGGVDGPNYFYDTAGADNPIGEAILAAAPAGDVEALYWNGDQDLVVAGPYADEGAAWYLATNVMNEAEPETVGVYLIDPETVEEFRRVGGKGVGESYVDGEGWETLAAFNADPANSQALKDAVNASATEAFG